jgi:hypothetical protein
MSDLLIAALPEEAKRIVPLVAGLRAAGFSVWSEADLAGGEHRSRTIAEKLAAARCVVVVWTTASVKTAGAELVQDVAARARERGVLLPVRLDRVDVPLSFGQLRILDLAQWNGKPRHRRFKEVVAAARAIVDGRPQPSAIKNRLGWLAWAALASGLATLLSLFADLQAVTQPVCRVPGIHAVCARWGLGGVPSPAEAAAWAARLPGDCAALRAHLARFPQGAYAEEAERRLQAARSETSERWTVEPPHRLDLAVRPTLEPWAGEDAARADAMARSGQAAERACAGYRNAPFRLLRATAEVEHWNCLPRTGGVICGFDGQAVCEVEVRAREQRLICP